jgi:hypothetical protein
MFTGKAKLKNAMQSFQNHFRVAGNWRESWQLHEA